MSNRCNICDCEVDYEGGGCAIMMAHVYDHTTSLINVSYCKDCYRKFVFKPMRQLNAAGYMNILLEEDSDGTERD